MNYKMEILVKGHYIDCDAQIVEGLFLIATPRKCRANNLLLNIELAEKETYTSVRGNHVLVNVKISRQNHFQFLINEDFKPHYLDEVDNPIITDEVRDLIITSSSYSETQGMSLGELLSIMDSNAQ